MFNSSRRFHSRISRSSLSSLSLAVLLVVTAFSPLSALAADDAEKALVARAKELESRIKDLRRDKLGDAVATKAAIGEAVDLHNELEQKSARKGLQSAVGKVLTDKKMGSNRLDAAEALGRMNDPRGAYKQLKKALPDVKTEEPSQAEITVLKVVGALAPDGAIPDLIEMMQKAKSNAVAKAAVEALGHYGSAKKRVTILDEMLDTMRRIKPAYTKGKRIGAATRDHWRALGRPMVKSMNQLTGQQIGDATEWLETGKSYKKKLAKLFVE